MKLLSVKPLLIIVTLAIIISGIKNTLEFQQTSFKYDEHVYLNSLEKLEDNEIVVGNKKSFQFEKPEKSIKKVIVKKIVPKKETNTKRVVETSPVEAPAYIQEDISLELIEYYNPNKFSSILKIGEGDNPVTGVLEAANGVVEKIDVTLPDGESLFVEYGEMKENKFTYTVNGEKLRGIIYKIDAQSYMVSLDEGPHKGTRMKFKSPEQFDTTYDQPVDAKIVEASIVAQDKGFTF
jgi:hypothetical protein